MQKIKIALIGYGKMGKEIDILSKESNFEVVSRSLENKEGTLDIEGIKKADVAIDFTGKDIVLNNIKEVSKVGVNMVIGTTGWLDELPKVKKIVEKNKIGLLYSPNFSVGANIFFDMIAHAAKLFSKFKDYDVYGLEIHHKAKLDSPSGTALLIADIVPGLKFNSVRAGRNPGFHEVTFDSGADSISLSHQAHNRSGFAKGALLAAEFIKGKKGVCTFDDVLKEN